MACSSPYKTCDLVLYGNPVELRSGPATVSAEGRGEHATGAAMHWEGCLDPEKREPGDRPGSHRFESALSGSVDDDSYAERTSGKEVAVRR